MKKVLAIIGPSCSGKDTVLKELLKIYNEKINIIRHYTTRPKRENEKNGEDYFFIDKEDFISEIYKGDYISVYKASNNWAYGIKGEDFVDGLNIGIFNTADIENFAEERNFQINVIYLTASSKRRIIRALEREEKPDINEIYRRYISDDESFYWMEEMMKSNEFHSFLEISTEDEDIDRIINVIKEFIDEVDNDGFQRR